MGYSKIVPIITTCFIVLILSSCSPSTYPQSNDNTEMWIAVDSENNIFYQTVLNDGNQLLKINNKDIKYIEDGYIFTIYADNENIYYVENYFDKDAEVKYLSENSDESKVLFSVENDVTKYEYREYLYRKDDSLFYNNSDGTLYEYQFSNGELVKRLEKTNCSVFYDNNIYYSDLYGNIYMDNLSFNNKTKIIDVNNIFSEKVKNTLEIEENKKVTGSIVRMSIYEDKLYFTFSAAFKNAPGQMFKCNLDGTQIKLISNNDFSMGGIGQFQIYNGKIYFLRWESGIDRSLDNIDGLYCMDLNGKNIEEINIEKTHYFYIYDDCIYYKSSNDEYLSYYNLKNDEIIEMPLTNKMVN